MLQRGGSSSAESFLDETKEIRSSENGRSRPRHTRRKNHLLEMLRNLKATTQGCFPVFLGKRTLPRTESPPPALINSWPQHNQGLWI
mmetsp:Transcript_19240/g.32628  ORF Transcript_19240/g.32628 Transcript_19240/m.32628 type:complete len:87 (+) Transcript_19240:321-581(+)